MTKGQFRILAPCWMLYVAGAVLLAGSALHGQTSIGKRYGSREPHTCANRKEPVHGSLTSAQAAQYAVCAFEKNEGDFAENVKLQLSKSHMINAAGVVDPKTDLSQPVYDIRGTFDAYSCVPLGDVLGQPGKNCKHYFAANATGLCYKDTFGEWNCVMSDPAAAMSASWAKNRGGPPTK